MVFRVYVTKKEPYAVEAGQLFHELRDFLGLTGLTGVKIVNRYDVEGITEPLFRQCVPLVFSEPPVDTVSFSLPEEGAMFAVEYLPGQFDQRAESASECIQLISRGERPLVRTARIVALLGTLTEDEIREVKKYVINPVEAREADFAKKKTLAMEYPVPGMVETLAGFIALDERGLMDCIQKYGLAMDLADAMNLPMSVIWSAIRNWIDQGLV